MFCGRGEKGNGRNWSLLGRDEGAGVLRAAEAPRHVPQKYKVGQKFSYLSKGFSAAQPPNAAQPP